MNLKNTYLADALNSDAVNGFVPARVVSFTSMPLRADVDALSVSSGLIAVSIFP